MYSDREANTMTGKGRLVAGLVICLFSMSVVQSVPNTTTACKVKEHDDNRHNKILRYGVVFGLYAGQIVTSVSLGLWAFTTPSPILNQLSGTNAAILDFVKRAQGAMTHDFAVGGGSIFALTALTLQIENNIPSFTFWSSFASFCGRVVTETLAAALTYVILKWYVQGHKILCMNSPTIAQQIAERRHREAQPELTQDEIEENAFHTIVCFCTTCLAMLAAFAFTGLYWGFVWRKWKDWKGCNNQVRVAFVWLVEFCRISAFTTGTFSALFINIEPNTIHVIEGVYRRRYRVVNRIPDLCMRIAIELPSSALGVIGLLGLINRNVDDATFWLNWTSAFFSNASLIYIFGFQGLWDVKQEDIELPSEQDQPAPAANA